MIKRSLINRSIAIAMEVFEKSGIRLPPFAFWTVDEWQRQGHGADEIRDCMLGWDVTDFGSGDFAKIGRTLFTLRNGKGKEPYPKTYAEKFILDPVEQRAPLHFHRSKREDIINRGCGIITVELTRCDDRDRPAAGSLSIQVDGFTRTITSGEQIHLGPGESLCIPPRIFHQFWKSAAPDEKADGIMVHGRAYGVSGEVSSVCDDRKDNAFADGCAVRFPDIEEDEARTCYLCQEYPSP